MSKTVLITGATGTVSRQVIHYLKGKGHRLIALVRNPEYVEPLEAEGLEVRLGDLEKSWTLDAAFEGIDTLWLVNPPTARAPEQSSNAVWAARKAGVKRIVRLSVICAEYNAPIQGQRLHALSDAELMASGMEWTILRPHFFMQNLLGMAAPAIAAGKSMDNFLDNGRIGLIDVRDIGELAAQALVSNEHAGQIYTLTGPETLSLEDVAQKISHATGRLVTTRSVTPTREYFQGLGAGEWLANLNADFMSTYVTNWGILPAAILKGLWEEHPADLMILSATMRSLSPHPE
ncbi:SDR family oxidoreductase [Candidatus Pantoea bituminis]|uniref:SDR family oxidoreductase n=1 Tax=Candidatus Pantoea bituminis TaxID=2831036 RepID=UPI001C05F2D3|nr:SDR family oxidoreductase [Pantoea bituminis]